MLLDCEFFYFFFNDTATTEIYTLSLHDALPIFEPYPALWARLPVSARPPPAAAPDCQRRFEGCAAPPSGRTAAKTVGFRQAGFPRMNGRYAGAAVKGRVADTRSLPHRSTAAGASPGSCSGSG